MEKRQITTIAVIAVVIAVLCTGAWYIMKDDVTEEEKGGLYALDATILDIDMGGMSGTPAVVTTLEYMYEEVYGDLYEGADKLTLSDAKADTTFWDEYCNFDSLVTVNSDGSISYESVVDDSTTKKSTLTIPSAATKLLGTGSAYATVLYYVICEKYDVEPFSDAAKSNSDLVSEWQSYIYGVLNYDSWASSNTYLQSILPTDYVSSCSSIKSYDLEQMQTDVKNATKNGDVAVLMGSATISKDSNATFVNTVQTAGVDTGSNILLNNSKTIPDTLAMVEQVATIFGYRDYVDAMIEDLELRMYKIYWSAQKLDESHKAYFEGSSGKSSSATSSGASVCKFFGWDTSLFTGAEIDTETLLSEKPDVMMYYTNDDRTMDEKMRVTS